MPQGLNVNNIVNVELVLSPLAAVGRNFGAMIIAGDSDVIDGSQRIREYIDIEGVAGDFGTSAPEYDAAVVFFDQSPKPNLLYIGRWLRTATSALLRGGILTASEQLITNWEPITDGSFSIDVDGGTVDVTSLNFTGQTNLNGVAAIIDAALTGAGIVWDGSRFVVTSDSTGVTSTLTYAVPVSPATGTDISAQLKLDSAGALAPIDGFDAESALDSVVEFDNISAKWYFLSFAASTMPSDDDLIDVAAYIEAASTSRVFVVTEEDTRTLDSTYLLDKPTRLRDLGYEKSFDQFSENMEYAAISLAGRFATVDFNGNNTTITGMFKQEPGVVGEILTQQQAQTLKDKRANVFVLYQNDTYIVQYGTMASSLYIDTRQGIDWLQNQIQVNVYNDLYTSTTKINQTDSGNNQVMAGIIASLEQGVTNGLIAPGVWNAPGFGTLSQGDFLPKGYYIFAPAVADQSQADREQRKSVTFQVAAKLAGAIHTVDIILNINR
jgi:hypothetical protein